MTTFKVEVLENDREKEEFENVQRIRITLQNGAIISLVPRVDGAGLLVESSDHRISVHPIGTFILGAEP